MEWFYKQRNKSVADNAKVVVKNMHQQLETVNKKCEGLEKLIVELKLLTTDSLEHEINRLEMRKRELMLELDTIDIGNLYIYCSNFLILFFIYELLLLIKIQFM